MPEFTLNQIKADPAFKAAAPQDRQAFERQFTERAWSSTKKDLSYILGSQEERQAAKEAFDIQHPMGPLTRVEEEGEKQSFIENIGQLAISGARSTIDALRTADDVNTSVDSDLALRVVQARKRQGLTYMPPAYKAANARMTAETKLWDSAKTFADKFKAGVHTVAATAKELITNPEGVAYLAAQSAANTIPSLIGMAIGSFAGKRAGASVGGAIGGYFGGPPGFYAGTAIGGAVSTAAGSFAGSLATEEGSQFISDIIQEVTNRNLEFTEENVHSILQDIEFVKEAQGRAKRKGLGTAVTDTILGVGIGRMGSAALKTSEGAFAKAFTKAKIVGAEIATEPSSELVGQLAREGKIDTGELMGETLGAIGTGPITAPVTVAAYGAKKAVTKVAEKVTEPIIEKDLADQAKAPTKYKYKEKVKQAIEEGTVTDTVIKENPIMAAEVLSKVNQKEDTTPIDRIVNMDKADKAYEQLKEKSIEIMDKALKLKAKKDTTPKEAKELKSLTKQAISIHTTMSTIEPMIESMRAPEIDKKIVMKDIHAVLKSDDSGAIKESILSIFGSKKGSDLSDSTSLEDIINNPKIDDSTKVQVKQVQAYQAAEKALISTQEDPTSKTMEEVHSDVIDGSPGFKGIKTFTQAVSIALKAGEINIAQSQVAALKIFADRHTEKAKVFTSAFKAVQEGKALNNKDQAKMDAYSLERQTKTGQPYSIHPGSGSIVETIAAEADALNKAVIMNESFIATPAVVSEITPKKSIKAPTKEVSDIKVVEEPIPVDKPDSDYIEEVIKKDTEPRKKAEIKFMLTQKDREQLKEIGFTEKEVKAIKPVHAALALKHQESSKEELTIAAKEFSADSIERMLLRELYKEQDALFMGIKDSVEVLQNKMKEVKTLKAKEHLSILIKAKEKQIEVEKREEDIIPIQKELTTPSEADPDNRVKNTFIPKVIQKGKILLLQTTNNILSIMNKKDIEQTKVFTEEEMKDADRITVINSIKNFGDSFREAFDKEWRTKTNKKFRYENPIEYLTGKDNILPDNIINAIMAVSYQWLGARASETIYNDKDNLRAILKLKDEEPINAIAYQLLTDIGVQDTMLIESLGKEIFQLLDIKPSETSDHNLQNKLEISLGMQAIATMQHMDLIDVQYVNSGFIKGSGKNSVTGLAGLINSQKDPEFTGWDKLYNTFKLPLNREGLPKFTTTQDIGYATFYRVRTMKDTKTDKTVIKPDIEKIFRKSKDTWDKLFKGEKSKRSYSWNKPKFSNRPLQLKNTTFDATEEQTKNLQYNEAQPQTISKRTMGMYLLMSQKNLDKIQGKKDLSKVHEINKKSVEGSNLGIDRSNQAIQDLLLDAKKQKFKYDTKFYTSEEFIRQGRMMQIGEVNRQGDKNHRFLIDIAAQNITFDLTNTDSQDHFMGAIALGLDIEISKVGGLQIARQEAANILSSEQVAEALIRLQKILKDTGDMVEFSPQQLKKKQEMYSEDMDIIANAVEFIGTGIYGLKTLIEYAKCTTAVRAGKKEFTTNLPTEIDGISNGMTIARFQLMGKQADMAEYLTAIQNAGGAYSKDLGDLAEHLAKPLSHDAYMSTGFAWTNELVILEQELVKKITVTKGEEKQDLLIELDQLNAIKDLLGEFRDEKGNVTPLLRKLSKPSTMTTVYGMGKKALLKQLTETVIAGIYADMEKVTTEDDVQGLVQLAKKIKNLIGKDIFGIPAEDIKKVLPDVILETKLTQSDVNKIAEHLEEYHGKALKNAITKVYGNMQTSFAPLNAGVSLTATLYNTARKLFIKQGQAIADNENREMTVKEYTDIDEKIKGLFPKVTTPFGGEIPLAKFSKEKVYSKPRTKRKKGEVVKIEEVIQSYQSKNLPAKHAAPFKKEGIEDPGVGGTILTIHNLDSIIANTLMGIFAILNNHDGFTVAINTTKDLSIKANEVFYKTMHDYDMGQEMYKAAWGIFKEFGKVKKKLIAIGVSQIDIDTLIVAELANSDTTFYTPIGAKKGIKITVKNYRDAMNQKIKEMKEIAEITAINKSLLMDSLYSMNQYYYPGGEYLTGNKTKAIEYKGETFKPTTITENTEDRLKTSIETTDKIEDIIGQLLAEQVTEEMKQDNEFDIEGRKDIDIKWGTGEYWYSSPKAIKLSVDPKDYALRTEINAMNVKEVYNQIKDDSTIIDSIEHDSHLQTTLDQVITTVMRPIDLFLKSNPDIEPEGKFVTTASGQDRVFINSQSHIIGPTLGALHQGIRMSTGEVYVHELVHSVVHTGLSTENRLSNQVELLYRLTEKELNKDGKGFRVFLNDPTIDINDPAYKYEVEAAKERFDYIFRETQGIKVAKFVGDIDPATGIKRAHTKSQHLDEFVALGITNENFIKALSDISLSGSKYAKSSWRKIKGANIQETLLNVMQVIMDIIYRKFTSRTTETTVSKELKTLAILLAKRDSENKSMLYKAGIITADKSNKFSELANIYVKKAVIKLPLIKVVHSLKTVVKFTKESDTVLGQWIREREYAYRRLDQGIIKSTIAEIRGRTDRLDWLYRLIDRRKLYLDAAKENDIEQVITTANTLSKKPMNNRRKSVVTWVGIKTDLSSLVSPLGLDGIERVLHSTKELDKEIKAVEDEIKTDTALSPWVHYYSQACDALGYFMVHSKGRSGVIPFQSTRVIAEMRNTKGADVLTNTQADKAEVLVDKLASLRALSYTAYDHKVEFSTFLKEDPQAITGIFQLHNILKQDALKNAFGGNKMKFIKGYTKQILNSRIGFKYGTIKDEAELSRQGYIRNPIPIERDNKYDPTSNTPFYIYTSKIGRVNDLVSTTLSYTSNRAKGTDSDRIAQEMGTGTAQGKANNLEIKKKKQTILNNMMNPSYQPILQSGNYMIPQVDDNGDITQYRYMMSETTKNNYLEQISEFDIILGSMAGQIVDKIRSPEINKELVYGLKAMYDAEYKNNPEEFVEVSPTSIDPKLREIFYMIPAATQKEIKKVWGSNKMFVSKDIIDLAFGYRQYSIVDAFTKTSQDRVRIEKMVVAISKLLFKEKAVQRMGSLENIMIEATKLAKSNIIVKSLYVTLNNLGSNLIYLKSRGVPIHKIGKLSLEAIIMGNKYQVDIKKLNQLKLKRKMTGGNKQLDSQILKLESAITRNPTTVTIEAGLMPTLIDDVETVTAGEKFPTTFDKTINKQVSKLPGSIQTVGKNIFVTEDSETYRLLNNAVKMTDYIGRHVLYNHYLSEGVNHKDAVTKVIDEFINFNIPTHRITEYLNTVGILWFTKYYLRILKVIKESVIDKPYDVFMAFILSEHLGLDNILNSIPGITKNIATPLGDPASMLLGSIDQPVPIAGIKSLLYSIE